MTACTILKALGEVANVNDENNLFKATNLSGTGPAYIFIFMEAMIDVGGGAHGFLAADLRAAVGVGN